MVRGTSEALVMLRAALARLAAPPSEQLDYLRELGVSPCADELALELDDVVQLVPQLMQEGHLTQEGADAIYAVDRKLAEMSDHQELWSEAAVQAHPAWAEVRRLATASVHQLTGTGARPSTEVPER